MRRTLGEYVADDDRALVDVEVLHGFLRTAYWSTGIPLDVVRRAVANSLCVGLYAADGSLVGFARAVTDRATFAWIADVFVAPGHRGHGLGRFVVSTLLDHPDLQGLRRTLLATADAHDLYRSYGFQDLTDPDRYLAVTHAPTDLYGES